LCLGIQVCFFRLVLPCFTICYLTHISLLASTLALCRILDLVSLSWAIVLCSAACFEIWFAMKWVGCQPQWPHINQIQPSNTNRFVALVV
jgi:hypothetical protein